MTNNYLMAHDYAFLTAFSVIALVLLILNVFFAWSMYKGLKLVPEEHYLFPNWFVWLILIPFVGFVFQWMMLPFGIPRPFEKAVANNEAGVRDAKKLFTLGLSSVILTTLGLIPFIGALVAIAGLVIWFVYWYQAVQFRHTYLEHRQSNPET